MELTSFATLFGAVCLEATGQVCFKLATRRASAAVPGRSGVAFVRVLMGSRWLVAGIVAYLFELLLWLAALTVMPLSVAYPLLATSYCVVVIASRVFLKEKLHARSLFAIALVTLGAALISLPNG